MGNARKSGKKLKEELEVIAWQGWIIPVLPDWRPIEIDGDYCRGKMMIGSSSVPVMQVKWWRPQEKNFFATEWIAARIREMKTFPSENPPVPADFAAAGWIDELEFKEDLTKTIWYGFAEKAGVVIEIVTTSIADKNTRELIKRKIIPGLKVTPEGAPSKWCLYKIAFTVPEGYVLKRKHLYSGDIALEFANSAKDILLVRQVYPAELALTRRTMKEWLNHPPFKTRRKLRQGKDTEWKPEIKNIAEGIMRSGRKCIAFPLQWLFPKGYKALIAKDSELDRLLIAEKVTSGVPDFEELEECIRSMNWSTKC